MNAFLLGNGFDLHHKFPTSYLNFLNTMKFLIEKYDDSFDTVAHVFGNDELQNIDEFIKECYEQHSGVYKLTVLPKDKIRDMIAHTKDNMWFNYLCNSVAKDIKWIDFEKEIIRVLEAFSSFFDCNEGFSLINGGVEFSLSALEIDIEDRYILSQFNFFFDKDSQSGSSSMKRMKDKYVAEKIVGSNAYHFVKDDMASSLYVSLRELTDVLKDYLLYFVDAPSNEYNNLGIEPHFRSLPTPNRVYSFNYTNTIQILYNNAMVDHIHGSTNTNIVLGVNPDENDNVESADTTFLQFKKYFQRVFFNTDIDFIRNMNFVGTTPRSNDTKLYVIGHSLDSTDKDVIKQIFDSVKTIIILYHSETSVKNQIKNLVEIYGKEGLDMLRKERSLVFLPQSAIQWVTVENN